MADDDATRAALQRLAQDGSDLHRPMKMEFFVAVPDQRRGDIVASRAAALGFAVSVEHDPESDEWTCYCERTIVPSYEVVTAIERQLDDLSRGVGGHADGFETSGNADA